jgi:hypothetical protein
MRQNFTGKMEFVAIIGRNLGVFALFDVSSHSETKQQ